MTAAKRILDPKFELADSDTIAAYQIKTLLEILQKTWSTNEFYRTKWQEAGTDLSKIKSLADFSARIPTVEKKDFVEDALANPPFGKRLAHGLSLKERSDIFTTSGTSGQGVEVHAQTATELRAMERLYSFLFHWAGLEPGDQTFLTLPITMLGGGRIEYQGAVGFGLNVYPVGNYDASRKLDLLNRFRPKALYGSTSYFSHLAAVADRSPPCPSIKVLLTGLEGAGYSYFSRLENQWQAKVADRFGCTQLRSDFMFTCEHGIGVAGRPGMLHCLDPFVLLEVIDPQSGKPVKDGEFGEIVVTSLYHFDNPVVRCRIRDGGVFRKASYCACGRPFGGVEIGTIGRTDDVKKVKGVNIYPQAVDDLMYSFGEVDEYQILLTTSKTNADIAAIKIMPKAGLPAAGHDDFVIRLKKDIHKKTGIHFDVELVADLPRSEYKARRWLDQRDR